jgi:CheY-like chemotaxis protein
MAKEVLFVDDDALIREIFNDAFSGIGYTVRLAESAEEALEMLRHEFVQVMFLDLNLPKMNGLDLCRHVKKDNPTAIIYALTGYASLFELINCREAGFDDYFVKPMKIEILLKAAEDAFQRIERWRKR